MIEEYHWDYVEGDQTDKHSEEEELKGGASLEINKNM